MYTSRTSSHTAQEKFDRFEQWLRDNGAKFEMVRTFLLQGTHAFPFTYNHNLFLILLSLNYENTMTMARIQMQQPAAKERRTARRKRKQHNLLRHDLPIQNSEAYTQ
jgi:hypothetical protein